MTAIAEPPYSEPFARHLLRLLLAIHAVSPQALPRARIAAALKRVLSDWAPALAAEMPGLEALDNAIRL